MDFKKILAELYAERDRLTQAISALENIGGAPAKRRGRPPKWMSAVKQTEAAPAAAPRKKRPLSPEARKRIADAQRKRWAAARKANG
jgi:hypothetical protein